MFRTKPVEIRLRAFFLAEFLTFPKTEIHTSVIVSHSHSAKNSPKTKSDFFWLDLLSRGSTWKPELRCAAAGDQLSSEEHQQGQV